MRKCGNCGKEYEGRYCPECGEEWLEEKECPQCGAKLSGSAKFCTECGYSFGKSGKEKKSGTGARIGEWFKSAGRWIKSHLKIVIPVASALVMIITVSCVLTSVLSNKFRVGKVSKIEIGYTQEQVLEILGEPYEDTKEEYKWEYYDGKCNGILEKLSANSKAQEKALLADDESKLEKLMEEELKLTEQLEGVTCKYIEVNFAPNLNAENKTVYTVSSVLFDTAHKYGEETKEKKQVKKLELSKESAYFFENLSSINLCCQYYYADGSYKCSALNKSVTDMIVSGKNAEWQDEWGDYSHKFKLKILNSFSDKTKGFKWGMSLDGGKIDFEGLGSIDMQYLNEYENAYYLGTDEYPYLVLYSVKDKMVKELEINYQCCIIYYSAFNDCRSLNSITVPDSVIYIPNGVFKDSFYTIIYYTGDIASYCKVNGLGRYSDKVFINNQKLIEMTNLVIPDGITNIGSYAFYNCNRLESITIPESVTNIGLNAFLGCDKLIQTEDGVKYVDNWVVDCEESAVSVTLRNGTAGIAYYAFYCQYSLTNVTIPDSVKGISDYAFFACKNLTTVTANGVIYIGDSAFALCESLDNVTFGNGLESIGCYAFFNCDNLKNITFSGTKAQWKDILKTYPLKFEGKYTVNCTDGNLKEKFYS